MTTLQLLLRNLRHFRSANLAVTVGVAVATAVLAGAMFVGDSVRESLRQLAVARLGPVEHALVAPAPFDQNLAGRVASQPDYPRDLAPPVAGLIVRGGATRSDETATDQPPLHVADVQIAGLSDLVAVPPGKCVLNGRLAGELGARVGDRIVLNLPRVAGVPLESILARRSRTDMLSGLAVVVDRIEGGTAEGGCATSTAEGGCATSAAFVDRFSLSPSQRRPRNAWVNLADLQEAIGQPGRANVLLTPRREGTAVAGTDQVERLARSLKAAATLDDYGLSVSRATSGPDDLIVVSRWTYLSLAVEQAITAAAKDTGAAAREIAVNLAATVEVGRGRGRPGSLPARPGSPRPGSQPDRIIRYAVIAGVSGLPDGPIPRGQAVLNRWAADQLAAEPGQPIRLSVYRRQPDGQVREVWNDEVAGATPPTFTVGRVLPMAGFGADRSLTPSFAGLTDQQSPAQWKLPPDLPIDRKLVTPADEDYWHDYGAAPKLFIDLDEAKALWGEPAGTAIATSVRIATSQSDALAGRLREVLSPAAAGMVFQPIRQQQFLAAEGTTDFAQLFMAFSFFIIAAAVLLVALLFRLSAEQRARQIGLLNAVGFSPARLGNLLLMEGAALAMMGASAGLAGGVAYCALIMHGLRTWWSGAVGTGALALHVEPASAAVAWASAIIVGLLAMAWGVRRVLRAAPAALLAGVVAPRPAAWGVRPPPPIQRRRRHIVFILPILLGTSSLVPILLTRYDRLGAQLAFLAAGGLLLLAALLVVRERWRRLTLRGNAIAGRAPLLALGLRNAARYPGRSLLAVALLAFASFVLVIVAAMKQGPADTQSPDSGAGGFALMLTADVPISGDLNTPAGRRLAGLRDSGDPIFSRARFLAIRRKPGQDASCRNMVSPSQPTILGVPAAMSGFTFADHLPVERLPWGLLDAPPGDDAIPMFADAATAEYSLHIKVGQSVTIRDEAGRAVRLRLVGTLTDSIFQDAVLVSEPNFRRLFPSAGGFGLVLVAAPPGDVPVLANQFRRDLGDAAVSVETTADRLAAYAEVANTYLATFGALGSLGLLLGTAGLSVVLVRSLIERRRELAVLAAIGFSPARRLSLVLVENAWLLVLGLAIGTAAAAVAIAPALVHGQRVVNLWALGGTLAGIALFGLAILTLTALLAGRRYRIGDLRAE